MSRVSSAWWIALVASANLGLLGCGASWPTVAGVGEPSFIRGDTRVTTIDILPTDIQTWTYPGSRDNVDVLAKDFEVLVKNALQVELSRRGYVVSAAFDWDGSHVGADGNSHRTPYQDRVVASTAYALSSYGLAQEGHDAALTPYLPVRLGGVTGADATLYVGGWAYAGEQRSQSKSRGEKAAAGIGIGLLLVGAVALAVVGIEAMGGGGGKAAKGAGKAVKGAGKAAGKVAHHAVKATGGVGRAIGKFGAATAKGFVRSGFHIGRGSAHVAGHVLEALAYSPGYPYYGPSNGPPAGFGQFSYGAPVAPPPPAISGGQSPGQFEEEEGAPPPSPALPDPRGTHFELRDTRPDYYAMTTPKQGRSHMMIEMTLVDNHSGRALWHVRQVFKADPRKHGDVAKVVGTLFKSLPAS